MNNIYIFYDKKSIKKMLPWRAIFNVEVSVERGYLLSLVKRKRHLKAGPKYVALSDKLPRLASAIQKDSYS